VQTARSLIAVVVLVVLAAGSGTPEPAVAELIAGAQPSGSSGYAQSDGPSSGRNGWHYVRRGRGAVAPAPVAKVQADGRTAYDTAYVPFAQVGGITLHHPSQVVERIGLHQSNHEGARDLELTGTAAAPVVLESRGRLSGRQSAADVVVAPDAPLRAPVSGTVIRAGTYVLYCDHSDDFVVISPDGRPEWEVKILHIDGVQVVAGDRVSAGVTVIAPRATVLPFASQVDGTTARPAWPHTHIEVIDPSIPNVSNGGSGSDC
jgi:murein DD-endopeptidase MepM/ murein hydrolase activator NlpD